MVYVRTKRPDQDPLNQDKSRPTGSTGEIYWFFNSMGSTYIHASLYNNTGFGRLTPVFRIGLCITVITRYDAARWNSNDAV